MESTTNHLNEKGVSLTVTQSAPSLPDPEARPACFTSTVQEALFVLVVTMSIAMASFLAGTVTVISTFVGKGLGMTTAEIVWMSSAASLAGGAFLLFFGKLADVCGRKLLLLVSLFCFSSFALGSAATKTAITLDVLNGFMGLATACTVPAALGTLGAIYEKPSKRKNYAFACLSAGNPIGFVFGTIFSGVAANIGGPRASLTVLSIIYFAVTLTAFFIVPNDSAVKQKLTWETLKQFDPVGVLLTIFGIGMFCVALSSTDNAPQGWRTPYILVLLILGLVTIIAFVVWETYTTYPLIPMSILRDRNLSLILGTIVLGSMSFPVTTIFLAMFFQSVWGMSTLSTAVHLLPMAITSIIVNGFAAMMLHRVSNRLLMMCGVCAYALSLVLFALNRQTDTYWSFCFVGLVVAIIGTDLQFNVANMYVMSSMPRAQQSVAGSILQTVGKLSQSVGYGIGTAVFNAVLANPSLGSYYAKDKVTQPYAAVFWFAAACAGVSLVLVWFLTIGTQGNHEKTEDEHRDGDVTVVHDVDSEEKVNGMGEETLTKKGFEVDVQEESAVKKDGSEKGKVQDPIWIGED
ncbi:hypothetical protein AAFC00_005062 [Neodothiora populina]|uniref:Major facilitator superfamily (MFS) profile domain-containing protein n=1 Tax=Neodothiora populina TaxID=2781224 RepID=A0ABR3PJN3_9PEZI